MPRSGLVTAPPSAQTAGMDAALAAWEARVRAAALDGDTGALAALFVEGRERFGASADHAWAEALAALDGNAVTG